ncbi:MAG: phenylacetate-CoA oxygenase subunit PaaI [Streptosporangiales bacterium]|nr:phenylacetate-CoA oxygenase subunit PaaI [Streptosporangiales bacterium]MBO0891375.1 phenylacetate-CoA oxygenase subunit PaaI [Acidothermales bacterium]
MSTPVATAEPAARTALQNDLLCVADTKLVLGNWFAECVMNGKSLPDFAAMLGMCTASYGQTRAIYHWLDTLDHSYGHLEHGRGRAEIRSMDLLDPAPENWQDFIVSTWLAEQATWSMASGFLRNPDRTVAGIARKIGEEAYFHLKYAAGWFRIIEASDEEGELLRASVTRRFPLALRWFGPLDAADDLHAAGLRDDPLPDIRAGFVGEVRSALKPFGVDATGVEATFEADWRPDARRTGPLPERLFEVIRFKDQEIAR